MITLKDQINDQIKVVLRPEDRTALAVWTIQNGVKNFILAGYKLEWTLQARAINKACARFETQMERIIKRGRFTPSDPAMIRHFFHGLPKGHVSRALRKYKGYFTARFFRVRTLALDRVRKETVAAIDLAYQQVMDGYFGDGYKTFRADPRKE